MASAQEHGEIIIQRTRGIGGRVPMKVQRSEILGYVAPASRTNPQEQDEKLIYREGGTVEEKQRLEFWFKSDSLDIIESEESKFHLDITERNIQSKDKISKALTFENMTGFTNAGAIDVTCPLGTETIVAYYEVPAGRELVLGRPDGRGKIYAYLGDDTA